jgi:hypothetical protein
MMAYTDALDKPYGVRGRVCTVDTSGVLRLRDTKTLDIGLAGSCVI